MNELMIGFSQVSGPTVFAKSSHIHMALTTAPGSGYFPAPSPTMPIFKAAIDLLGGSLNAETTPTVAASREANRLKVVNLLQKLAAGLELTADGNLVSLAASGYDLKTKPTRSAAPLPPPINLRVATTGTSGEAMCKCKAVPLADSYECGWTLDPIKGPWTNIPPVSNSQTILFTDLDRGKDYYFHIRAIGANGPSGWSDVATMMVV
jgi:hypothetical protein